MPTRKEELTDRLVAYLEEHGPTGLSLRPMAAAVGTSARLLVFHFGSRDALLTDVLAEIQARLRRSLRALQAARGRRAAEPLLRSFWRWALEGENFRRLGLLYQLHVMAMRSPRINARYLKDSSRRWTALIQGALPKERGRRALATLYGAVFDGLFLELMGTGDRRTATQALDLFLDLVRRPQGLAGPRNRR